MKLLFAILLTAALTAPAGAELIDNGEYTADTASGLDWLDLSTTAGLSWVDASAQQPEWRHATHEEVAGLFKQMFPQYDKLKSKSEGLKGGYKNQLADIQKFSGLFGLTYDNAELFSMGYYRTREGDITAMGTREVLSDGRMPPNSFIFGMLWHPKEPFVEVIPLGHIGSFMVRQNND